MAKVNICGTDDQFARYKMPKLETKIEGKGNGIKTVITNMDDVSRHLHRPGSYATKYFGCVLGAQTKYDEKTGFGTVNGAHDTSALQELLTGFIKKFVLCEKCHLPETDLKVSKKTDVISAMCRACGNTGTVDPREKLATFIVKNPPPKKGSKGKEEGKKDERQAKKERRLAKEERRRSTIASEGDVSKKKKKPQSDDEDEEDEEEEELETVEEDTSEAAASKKEKSEEASVSSPAAKVEEKAVEGSALFAAVKEKISEESSAHTISREAKVNAMKEIFSGGKTLSLVRVQVEAGKAFIAESEMVEIMFEVLFDVNAKANAEKQTKILKSLSKEKGPITLVQHIEYTFAVPNKEHISKAPFVFKVLYDEDIVEEEQIIEWYEKNTSKMVDADQAASVRKAVKPFVEWLQTAEEESD